ncbi:anoctamin-10 isoform X2 [Bradysia coprophila]|uniref:anoctamin-10 isoform X2 n=1 Tax=Bradysia coprophila TaxID=38358 RepID=UPI00187D9C50|nr:anoctamin-10 isoform X2 [Bradysia coprophila]XP_037040104.1 anoctamin-10 isoform X2 [Bradysia coprophila]
MSEKRRDSVDSLPLPLITKSQKDVDNIHNPRLRQRNIQIKTMESMDRAETEDDDESLSKRRVNFEENTDEDIDSSAFETYLVIKFANNVNSKSLRWIVDKIRGKKNYGGAELLIRKEPNSDTSQGLVLHLSATSTKFFQMADELEIMKKSRSGVMKNFNVSSLDDFFVDGSMDVENILTSADKQIIVKHALDSIKASEHEKSLPGSEHVNFYHGQSIISACLEDGIVESVYPLQNKEFLKKFGPEWYLSSLKKQPVEKIREYFGESVGIYFCFVEYYTVALVVPAILGIVQYFTCRSIVPFFCIFYVIWMTIFLEVWKRKCSALAYRWGTITMTNLDQPRVGFYGTIGKDPITGKMQPQYPIWKTYVIMYCVSIPLCLICMIPAALLAVSQFWLEGKVTDLVGPDSWLTYLPSIFEAICVAIFSGKFEALANWLTDRENHRTQAQYERHRVVKLIALEFVNNFLSLFYIAFWLRDVNMVRSQLMTQLIVFQIVQKMQGSLYPIAMSRLLVLKDSVLSSWYQPQEHQLVDLNISELPRNDPRIKQNKYESTLLEYNSTYEDYLEMYIQFGYVVLFASVAPLAALTALVNNIIEIRLDAFKLCKMYKRPLAKRAKNTGAWLLAFETLLVMSIITNCGLLYLQPEVSYLAPNSLPQDVLMAFVVGEHILLGVAWAINKAIPDRPWWVRVALAKADYESRQAMKREVKIYN